MFFIKWSNVTYQNISHTSANNFYHEWMVLILLWCVRLSCVLEGNIIRSCRYPGHNSVFKVIFSVSKKKLFIFMLILSWGFPLSFFEHWEKCLNLEKKCPDCGHLWVKCLIENDFFKSFQTKTPEIFSLRCLS